LEFRNADVATRPPAAGDPWKSAGRYREKGEVGYNKGDTKNLPHGFCPLAAVIGPGFRRFEICTPTSSQRKSGQKVPCSSWRPFERHPRDGADFDAPRNTLALYQSCGFFDPRVVWHREVLEPMNLECCSQKVFHRAINYRSAGGKGERGQQGPKHVAGIFHEYSRRSVF